MDGSQGLMKDHGFNGFQMRSPVAAHTAALEQMTVSTSAFCSIPDLDNN
jgi:hypothetical protein